ncbi:MAG: SBBP repeat-containing protein [Planctomycetota bacterium]
MSLYRKIKTRLFNPANSKARAQSPAGRTAEYQKLEPRCLMAGDFVWANHYSGGSTEVGQAVVADSAGNVYTVGNFSGTVDFESGPGVWNVTATGAQDGYLTKVNANGVLVWVQTFSGTGSFAANAMEIDQSGSIFISGSFNGTIDFDPGIGTRRFTTTNGWEGFVTKMDFQGNSTWARQIGGSGTALALGHNGDVFVSGFFSGTRDFDPGAAVVNLSALGEDGYILKLNGSGNYVWAREFNAANTSSRGIVNDIAVDPSGNVYTTGQFQGQFDFDPGSGTMNRATPTVESDAFVNKLDSAGNFVWVRTLSGASSQAGMEIEFDSSGRPLIAGNFSGTTDFDPTLFRYELTARLSDIFVWKLDGDGNLYWANQIGGANQEFVTDLMLDGRGGIYLYGSFSGTTDFNPSTAVSNLTSAGGADGFIGKWDAGGNYLWARQLGGTDSDEVSSIALDNRFNILSTGNFRGTADMNPRSGLYELTSRGVDAFSVKLTQSIVYRTQAMASELTLRRSGNQYQIVNDATGFPMASRPVAHYLGAEIRGSNVQDDRLTLDFGFGGPLDLPAGVIFNGGNGLDSIRVRGSGAETVNFSTGQVNGRASYAVMTGSQLNTDIVANNVESATLSRVDSVEYITRGSEDSLTASPVSGDLPTAAVRLSGTSGLINTVPFIWNDIPTVDLNLGMYDYESAPNDSITFNPGGFSASGLRDLTVVTGIGDDQLNVNQADFRLALEGGELSFVGGDGFDKLFATADTNLTLGPAKLASGAGGNIGHEGIEYAQLIGGAEDNILDASGFNGMVSLYGLDGNDFLRGTSWDDELSGGDGDDVLFGGLGNDSLNGGAGRDKFHFEGTDENDELLVRAGIPGLAVFERFGRGGELPLERDYYDYDREDKIEIQAKDGDDIINIDLAFENYGIVDGGFGDDTCEAPSHWTRISC